MTSASRTADSASGAGRAPWFSANRLAWSGVWLHTRTSSNPRTRDPEVDALIDRQSLETDLEKRRRLVWDIETKLIEDDVRPVLFHPRGAVCNQPWVKGMTQMVNGIYNGSRFEDVWLDK